MSCSLSHIPTAHPTFASAILRHGRALRAEFAQRVEAEKSEKSGSDPH